MPSEGLELVILLHTQTVLSFEEKIPHLPPRFRRPCYSQVCCSYPKLKMMQFQVRRNIWGQFGSGFPPKLLLVDLTQGFPERQKSWWRTSLYYGSNLPPLIGIGLTNLPKYAGAHNFPRSCFSKLILFQSRGRLCPFHRHLPNLILKCFAGPATAIFVSELWFLIT